MLQLACEVTTTVGLLYTVVNDVFTHTVASLVATVAVTDNADQ